MYSIVSSANCFTSFLALTSFISVSSLSTLTRTSKTLLNKMARVNILVLFLILEEMFSAFHPYVWCWLKIGHAWPLYWDMSPLCSLSEEFLIMKVEFVKSFFCIYWNDHIFFILQFVNMVYCTDWFVYIEESLHPRDKSHLIMVYDPFNVLLDEIW